MAGLPFRAYRAVCLLASTRCQVGVAVLIWAGLGAPGAQAALTLTQKPDELVVTSSAGATWRAVFAIAANPSARHPGGGITRALYIPATSTQSIGDPRPTRFSAYGIDNMEWRYISGGGIRADMARHAAASSFEILEKTSQRIVFRIRGSWRNVPSFERTTTIDPHGYATELEATWSGPTGFKSMWWLLSRFRSDAIDGDKVTIRDRDTGPVPLPHKKECVCSVPAGIDFPYTVTFPLRSGKPEFIELEIVKFDDENRAGKRYEFWPEIDGHYFFFPRWVSKFEQRSYRFQWRWTLSGVPDDATPPSAPTRLRATPRGSAQIDLVWRPARDAESSVQGYKVYRNGTVVGSTSEPRFRDSGLSRAAAYSYAVSAINGRGLEGSRSASLAVKTQTDPKSLAASRTALLELIQRGIAAGTRKSTSISLGGRVQRVRLLSATPKALNVQLLGNNLPLPWGQFSSRELYHLAKPCASTSADHEVLARFCREAGFARHAARELRMARALARKASRPDRP